MHRVGACATVLVREQEKIGRDEIDVHEEVRWSAFLVALTVFSFNV